VRQVPLPRRNLFPDRRRPLDSVVDVARAVMLGVLADNRESWFEAGPANSVPSSA